MNEMSVLDIIKAIIRRKWLVILTILIVTVCSLLGVRALVGETGSAHATVTFALPSLLSQTARGERIPANIINSANEAGSVSSNSALSTLPLFSVSGDLNQEYFNSLMASSEFSNYLLDQRIFQRGDKLTVNVVGTSYALDISPVKSQDMQVLLNRVLSAARNFVEVRVKNRLQVVSNYSAACIAEDSKQIKGISTAEYQNLSQQDKSLYDLHATRVSGYQALKSECDSMIDSANLKPETFISSYIVDSESTQIKVVLFTAIGLIFGVILGCVLAVVAEYFANIKLLYKQQKANPQK